MLPFHLCLTRAWFVALVLMTMILLGACPQARAVEKQPNVLLILADDLGYSDLGCYGGEIATPHLDKLAAGGVRFTQFYNMARCCPSRACLLTGQYPHAVNFPGMSGSLPDTCATIPEVLKRAGYRTLMAGKWHLGKPGPVKRGFDDYYGMLGGFGSFWDPKLYTRLPPDRPARTYAPGQFYATDAITDHALDFVADARKTGKPWFLYLAYTAPHFPLHAPHDLIEKYADVYRQGWDKIREARHERQVQLGLADQSMALTPRSVIPPNGVATKHGWSDKSNPAWDSLDADRQADLARRMAIFAAMVERMDQNIGRVVGELEKHHDLDNTLILFLSDNGACAEWDPFGFDNGTGPDNVLHKGDDLAKMGGPHTYHSYGSGWANACNTPFRLYKHYNHEGGIATPLIAHWPAGIPQRRRGVWEKQPGHLIDLLPTCAEVAGADYPSEANGKKIAPPAGVSLVSALKGQSIARSAPLFWEHEGNRAIRVGDWKLVALAGRPWELYDLATDRTELHDLAGKEPKRVEEMARLWDDWALQNQVRVRKTGKK